MRKTFLTCAAGALAFSVTALAQVTPTPGVTPAPGLAEPPVPPPSYANTNEPSAVEASNTFKWSEVGAPTFTIDQAVITALQQNPDILRAKEEIERTRGVIIQLVGTALPHITPTAT